MPSIDWKTTLGALTVAMMLLLASPGVRVVRAESAGATSEAAPLSCETGPARAEPAINRAQQAVNRKQMERLQRGRGTAEGVVVLNTQGYNYPVGGYREAPAAPQ